MVLSSPYHVIEGNLYAVSPIVVSALDFGLRGHFTSASLALDALDDWLPRITNERETEQFFRSDDILFKLGSFLSFDDSTGNTSTVGGNDPQTALKQRQKNAANLSLRAYRDRTKLMREAGVSDEKDATSESGLFARRVLSFLGRLGSNLTSQLAVVDPQTHVLAWDPSTMANHVKLTIPFRDSQAVLVLDSLLPRVCELALHAPDAQTKTSACELLHSTIVFVIGSAATTPEAAREEASKHQFFRRVIPVVLQLCAATESFIQELFLSLAFPLIRWLTSVKQVCLILTNIYSPCDYIILLPKQWH